jgi:hypothetical protein
VSDVVATVEPPADRPSRASHIWRIVAIAAAFYAVLMLAGVVLFAALGLANDGVGSCGGG